MTMEDRRLELQNKLLEICPNVYFQPPASLQMSYPAIRFKVADRKNKFGNDVVYGQSHYFEVTVIDFDPVSEVFDKVSMLPTAKFNNAYSADGLNHQVFTINYK